MSMTDDCCVPCTQACDPWDTNCNCTPFHTIYPHLSSSNTHIKIVPLQRYVIPSAATVHTYPSLAAQHKMQYSINFILPLCSSVFACQIILTYEGWNFNFGNATVTFDTAHLQSSYLHRPSMYSPKLCRTRSQWWGSCMMPLAAPVLLMVRTERSTAEGLNPPCNCPIR